MKKKSVSTPELPNGRNVSSRRTSKTDIQAVAEPTTSISTKPAKKKTTTSKKISPGNGLNALGNGSKTKPVVKKTAKSKSPSEPEISDSVSKQKKTENGALDIPPILLESDEPVVPSASGPGEKYSLGAKPPNQNFSGGELPESYGTKKLFLTARDPHWLYAHWDLTREQQNELNNESTDGHLILRIFAGKIEGHPAHEIHVHPDSRHWFAHVERAGNSYTAELGYYSELGKWTRVAVSSGTVTPPDAAAKEDTAEFATIPYEFPFARLMQIIEDAVRDNVPLAQAIEELRRTGHPDLPRFAHSIHSPVIAPGPTRQWTPEQEKALAKIISIDETRRVWMGSLEITELIRRRLAHEVASPVTGFGMSSPGFASSPTSPFGAVSAAKEKSFWFNVNAELIIYGATEPDAKVTLAGHEIKLRSDGTFSFRFALPDGHYDLPAVAVSADGTDGRAAELKFSRETQYLGDVGATPQDPSLQPPLPENI